MPSVSAVLSMPYIEPSQAQKHVTHNEALRVLDVLTQLSVLDRTLTVPPTEPATGDCYIVAASATGDWAGHDQDIAVFEDTYWRFETPKTGWRGWVVAENAEVVFDGTGWATFPTSLSNIDGLGIMTSYDSINRLAVASEASLLTHAGAGHQLKINKAAVGDTNSLLFQTNWSGRAEMGLAGSDAFSIKVSPDGGAWITALEFDPATGAASGAAVQATPDDTTAGRLMRADYGYGPGNLLGAVSLSGGTPTGAVIESGTGYVRFADGTQIATAKLTLVQSDAATVSAAWSFGQSFITAPMVQATLDMTSTSGLTPTDDALLGVGAVVPDGVSATISLKRVAGQTDFGVSDSCDVFAIAIGRWA